MIGIIILLLGETIGMGSGWHLCCMAILNSIWAEDEAVSSEGSLT